MANSQLINESRLKKHSFSGEELNSIFKIIAEIWQHLSDKTTTTDKIIMNKWYIGVTDNIQNRRDDHERKFRKGLYEDFECFKFFKCDNTFHAAAVESFFIDCEKMLGDKGGWKTNNNAYYVYCFYVDQIYEENE